MAEGRKTSTTTEKDPSAEVAARRTEPEVLLPLQAKSSEVALHELSESIVTCAVGIQRELHRYSENNGAFLLEDMEVDLPMRLRVDDLGQVMAELVGEIPANTAVARVRLRIRPAAQPVDRIPIVADQPLQVLETLSKEQIAFLESHRIFSVEDLIRASRNAARKKALASAIPESVLDRALSRGGVLVIPVVPARIAEALLRAGVQSVDDFLGRDPSTLAPALAKVLGESVTRDHVSRWQEDLREIRDSVEPSARRPGGAPPRRPRSTRTSEEAALANEEEAP